MYADLFHHQLVIESPVRSGYWPLGHSNRTLAGKEISKIHKKTDRTDANRLAYIFAVRVRLDNRLGPVKTDIIKYLSADRNIAIRGSKRT
jgi:hypothetical protein